MGLILTDKEECISEVKVTGTLGKIEYITLEFITAKEENKKQSKTSILDCLAVQRKYKDFPEPEILKWKTGQKIKLTTAIASEEKNGREHKYNSMYYLRNCLKTQIFKGHTKEGKGDIGLIEEWTTTMSKDLWKTHKTTQKHLGCI